MAEPAAPPPACARCGAFDPAGPAAELGFPICAECLDWRPARPSSLLRRSWAPSGLAPYQVALGVGLGVTVNIATPAGFALALAITVAAFAAWLWRRPARTAAQLGLDIERLRVGSGDGALAVPVLGFESVEAPLHALRPREIAFLVANRRGLLVYGPTLRGAGPWRTTSAMPTPLARGIARIDIADRGACFYLYACSGWGGVLPGLGGRRLLRALEPLRAAARGAP